MNFAEMIVEIQARSRRDDTDFQDQIKTWINEVIRELVTRNYFSWMIRKCWIRLPGTYTTGTVAVNVGAHTITLTDGTFPDWIDEGSWIKFDSEVRPYELDYKVNATSAVLAEPYMGDANLTASTYTVFQWEIGLPADFFAPISLHQAENEQRIMPFTDREIPESRVPLEVGARTCNYTIGGQHTKNVSQAGTVSVTNAGVTVTGNGTSWSAATIMRQISSPVHIRIGTEQKRYKIRSIDSATQITLAEAYQGTTASAQQYDIRPTPSVQMRLYPVVSSAETLYMRYYALPKYLVGNDEEPEIPDMWHRAIINGTMLKVYEYEREDATQLEQQAGHYMADIQAMLEYDRATMPDQIHVLKMSGDSLYEGSARPYYPLLSEEITEI